MTVAKELEKLNDGCVSCKLREIDGCSNCFIAEAISNTGEEFIKSKSKHKTKIIIGERVKWIQNDH